MASPNYGDRILKLEELLHRLTERVAMLEKAADKSEADQVLSEDRQKKIEMELGIFKTSLEELKAATKENSNTHLTPDLAVLKAEVGTLKANQEKFGNRLWAVLAVAVGALLTWVFRELSGK